MKLSIRGYRKVARADIEAAPIALIAGLNESGKSSLVQAAQAALTQRPVIHSDVKKKDAMRLVHRGEDAGVVTLEGDGGKVILTYPKCTVDGTEGAPHSTDVAAGLVSLTDLKPAERAGLLARYIQAAPTATELAQELADAGYSPEQADSTWKAVCENGWDAVHEKAVEFGSKQKGAWEEVTGEAYGAKKADTWAPAGLSDKALSDLEDDVSAAKKQVEQHVGGKAVSAAEVDRLRELADAGSSEAVRQAQSELDEKEAEYEAVKAEREALPPADNAEGAECPSCGTRLVADTPWKSNKLTLKVAEAVDEKELKARQLKRASLDGKFTKLQGEVGELQRKRDAEQRAWETAQTARGQLAHAPAADEEAEAREAEDRAALAEAEKAVADFHARDRAALIHQKIQRNARIIDILAPSGLRKTVTARELGEFNKKLAALCQHGAMPAVRIDAAMNVFYGDEAFADVSESAQMRTRIALQVQMAMLDGSTAVVIDRADAHDAKRRSGVFKILKHSGLKAIVAGTMPNPELVPDLAKAGMGRAYWMRDGVCLELVKEQKEAA